MITLATLEKATAQEVFDQVVNHLREQKVPSEDDSGDMCMYRKEKDGVVLKCAAGCLIADNEYDPLMEGSCWESEKFFVPVEHQELIRSLQKVHDNYSPEDWEYQLYRVTVNYYLRPSVLERLRGKHI